MDTAHPHNSDWKSSLDLVVLILSLGFTFSAWKLTSTSVTIQQNTKLTNEAVLMENAIQTRVHHFEGALAGAKGLFSASQEVERDEFRDYFKGLDFTHQYPGIYSFTYVVKVTDTELDSFYTKLQSELTKDGFSGEIAHLPISSSDHYLINYIAYEHDEPPTAYGFDLATDPIRKIALETARDTGKSSASAPFIIKGPEEKGFIMTTPIYKNGAPLNTVSEKREALVGWVNAVILYEDLFAKTLTPSSIMEVHVKDSGQELFDDDEGEDYSDHKQFFNKEITVLGRTWGLEFLTTTRVMTGIESNLPITVLLVGSVISVLLFGLTYSLTSANARAQHMAKTMTAKINSIIASMGDGLMVIDKSQQISLINQTATKLLNIETDAALGKKWTDLIKTYEGDKPIPDKERTAIKALLTKKPIVTTIDDNHYYETPTGKRFPITSTTTPLPEEYGGGIVKVFQDITREKQERDFIESQVRDRTKELNDAWFQIQREKAKLTASLNSLNFGFIIIDPLENVSFINPNAIQTLGMLTTPTNFKILEESLSTSCDLHKLHEQAKTNNRTVESRNVLFGNKYLDIFISPIIIPAINNDYIGTAILIQDVTEARILERSKDEFFSIASHELRTPLTAIRGNTSMIKQFYQDKLTADPDLSGMIEDIHKSSISLIGIVNDFLNMSRLEQNRMTFKNESFSLNQLINQVIEDLASTAKEKNIYLVLSADSPQVNLVSDPERIKEVLINLIGNAIKFTESGGVTVGIQVQENRARVMITDTGRGIPIAQQNLLFRKFQQAGESLFTRDTTKGTGLGLYISKLIIEGLGGQIGLLWSDPSKGSCFYFSLVLK